MSLLCAFEAVSRHLSFTAAAEELHITQSAVSRHIKLLEQTIGKELFIRDKRGAQLSPAGEIYAKEIRISLRNIYSATQNIKFNQDQSSINLAVLPMFGSRWLAPRLPNFVARHPDITINMITKLVPFDFQFENIDLAVHYGLDDWPGAELRPLMAESTVPVCSQIIVDQFHFERPADLLKAPLLHLASRADAWERWFRSHEIDPVGMRGMIFDQFSTLTQLAVSGLGIALLPLFLIKKEIESGELVVVGDTLDGLEKYYIATPKNKTISTAANLFQEWIVREIEH